MKTLQQMLIEKGVGDFSSYLEGIGYEQLSVLIYTGPGVLSMEQARDHWVKLAQ